MRATLLGLILLNALYWAWSHWIDTPPTPIATSSDVADLPSLRLVSEVDGEDVGTFDGGELNLEDVQPLIVMETGSDLEASAGPAASTMGAAGNGAPGPGVAEQGLPVSGSPDSGSSAPDTSAAESSDMNPPVSIPFAAGQNALIIEGPNWPGPIPPQTVSSDTESPDEGSQDAESSEAELPEVESSDAARAVLSASVPETSGNAVTGITATDADESGRPAARTDLTLQDTNEDAVATDGDATGNQPLLASSVVMASDPIANPARCDSVGPFLSLRQARAAVTLLNGAGVPTQQRVEEAEVWVGHWVHLPPYPTREAAVAVVERLRREGVKDIYIETGEELRNSISLGLFSDIEGAEIRAGKVRKLGVRPQIVDRRRDGLVYWVDLELRAGSSIDTGMFDVLPHQTLRIESVACTGRLGTRE